MNYRIFLLLCALSLHLPMLTAQINRQMKVESIEESMKINPEPERSLLIVRSQIPNLKFESNRNIDRVHEVSSGYWEVWLPAGTHLLKLDANGFERLELPPKNFGKKRTYEMRIIAVGYAPTARADDNLIEVVFRLNRDSVSSSYGEFAPIVSRSRTIAYKVPKGEYTFTFKKDGCKDELRTVNVTSLVTHDVALSVGASTVLFTLPGIVHITSDPAGAEIVINGQRIGTTPYQGELSSGTHQLELRKVLHYPNISEFSLKEGETKTLSLSLKPRFGLLAVTTNPPGARITIDGKDAGTSPLARRECETGTHVITAESDLYNDASEKVVVADGEMKNLTLTLEPAFGTLSVKTMLVDSADVFVDGRKIGSTPLAGARLRAGKYILKLSKPLYADVEDEIVVETGRETSRMFALSQNFGSLTVNAPESDIYLDGKKVGSGVYRGQLQPKRYVIRADRGEKYTPSEKAAFVKMGESEIVTLEPAARVGSLSIMVSPDEASRAEIFVDHELKGTAPIVLPLLVGEYSVTARMNAYVDAVRTVTVKERENSKVNLEMLPYDGSREQVKGRWGTVKWVSAASAVAAGGAALYFHSRSEAGFRDYNNASTTGAAADFRKIVERNDKLYNIGVSVAAAAISSAVISWVIQSVY